LERDGNVPSVNDSVAKRAINDANRSTDDLLTNLGILSITDDLAGMLRINLLTLSANGGCKSVSNLPVYKERFELYKFNIKQTWKTIKLVLNSHNSPFNDTFIINNKTTTDKSIIANKFNEYFINIGPSLANKIPPSDISFLTYMKGNFTKSFGFVEINSNEVISIVKYFNTKPSAG